MKKEFSTHWVSSKQVRKQRKYRYNAPLHLRRKFLSAILSKELRKKYNKRNVPLKKGDEVLVMRGKFAKKKGKIIEIDTKKSRVVVEGINRSKLDGTKVNVYFNASNLMIQSVETSDKKRFGDSKMEKKVEEKKTEKKETKKVEEKKETNKEEVKKDDKTKEKKDVPKTSGN